MEKTFEAMTQTKDGLKYKLTSASLALKLKIDEDLAFLLERCELPSNRSPPKKYYKMCPALMNILCQQGIGS